MDVYTTCQTCHRELKLEFDGQHHHGTCPPPPRLQIEVLATQFVEAVMRGDDGEAAALEARIEEYDSRPPRLGDAALVYARDFGWPVFPLKPHDKRPATKHGFKDATTDLERIQRYWAAHPQANIGIPTGIAFDVIDIDTPDGPQSLIEIDKAGAIPPVHGRVVTASGGLHLFVEAAPGRGNATRIKPGIDYRGTGGYVVAPPSWLGQRGRSWSWLSKPSPRILRKERP